MNTKAALAASNLKLLTGVALSPNRAWNAESGGEGDSVRTARAILLAITAAMPFWATVCLLAW